MLVLLKSERGSVALIVALAMVCLLGFAAMVIDVGLMYMARMQLVNEADAAALAGAQDLPVSTTQAQATARNYAVANAAASSQLGDTFTSAVGNGNTSLTVNAFRTVNLLFARALGLTTRDVTATATATISAVGSAEGVVPFGVVRQQFEFGRVYNLKVGGGDGTTGNYGALALGGRGSRNYADNIKFGYEGTLTVGQWVTTETGNMSGPTDSGVAYRVNRDPCATYSSVGKDSPRIIVIPVLDSLNINGRGEVLIVGFATFFLESSHKGEVIGRFLRTYAPNTTPGSGTSYGYYNIRLTQ